MIKRFVLLYVIFLTPCALCSVPLTTTITFVGRYDPATTASWSDQVNQNFSTTIKKRIEKKPDTYTASINDKQIVFKIVMDYTPSIKVELCNHSGGIISFRGTLPNGKHYDSGWTSRFDGCFAVGYFLAGTKMEGKWSTWKTKDALLPNAPLPGKYQFECWGAVLTTGKCRLHYFPA